MNHTYHDRGGTCSREQVFSEEGQPGLRVSAAERRVMRDEVVPRVRTAVDLARPEIERARQNVRQAGRNVKKSIAEKSSLRDAKDFLSGFKKPPK